MGLSQGGSVVCIYLMRLSDRRGSCHPLRFAVLIASGNVTDGYLNLRTSPVLSPLAKEGRVARQILSIPSLHAIGDMDETKSPTTDLTRFWEPGKATLDTLDTSAGLHSIPNDASSVGRVAAAANVMIRSAI
ncbi:hypothetical protein GMORB2_3138 [Geosmithia morbida]|uniref:Serine hydrolase domain-containing protein n=1 Tax=Geosmithia morbida TaxID=1094350 RepID=A0A9P4YR74_9HYPO|nr:uncharacterized protein GMORB2_3138 [Geosmithia morbida]KAF4120337.1 hypothetical protein GMORB2_3138 [Geosmithia morbida]